MPQGYPGVPAPGQQPMPSYPGAPVPNPSMPGYGGGVPAGPAVPAINVSDGPLPFSVQYIQYVCLQLISSHICRIRGVTVVP